MFELICCECGDDPDLNYPEVPLKFQWMRGPYLLAAGIAAYEEHVTAHHGQDVILEQEQELSNGNGC